MSSREHFAQTSLTFVYTEILEAWINNLRQRGFLSVTNSDSYIKFKSPFTFSVKYIQSSGNEQFFFPKVFFCTRTDQYNVYS